MASESLLRINWYSFLIGTQVAGSSTILSSTSTSASTTGFRRLNRFSSPREFIFPTVINGGTTIFLFRIKQGGNGVALGLLKIWTDVMEKYIVGGLIYSILEKRVEFESSVSKAGAFGGLLGMFFSFRYDMHQNFWETLLCGMMSGELTVFMEELKRLIIAEGYMDLKDFEVSVPFESLSFWNGALVGCAVGLQQIDLSSYLDFFIPELEESSSDLEVILAALTLFRNIVGSCFRLIVFMQDRLLVGGFIYCACEAVFKSWKGEPSPILLPLGLSPICATLLGLYLGATSSTYTSKRAVKRACQWSLAITGCFRVVFLLKGYLSGRFTN